MKKRGLKFAVVSFCILLSAIFLFNFVSSAAQAITIDASIGEAGEYKLYTISVTNLEAAITIPSMTVFIPGNFTVESYDTSSVGAAKTNPSSGLFNFTATPLIAAGATEYFWFNMTTKGLGSFGINITTFDDASASASENETITISDTIAPVISFVSPTPADDSTINKPYIEVNVSVVETGSGLKNVTIYFYNATGAISSYTGTSSPFFHNFTSLADKTYSVDAVTYDYANHSNTLTRTIEIDTAALCTSSWTCEWSACVNGTQTKVNCVDANHCNISAPTDSQACGACVTLWDCTEWMPVICSEDGNQTRTCDDLNNCTASTAETRECVLGSPSSQQGSQNKSSIFSSSVLFFVVLGVIVLSVLGVVIALMRLKRKSTLRDFGNNNSGYKVYPPPGPPSPPSMPPGYPNSRPAYPNNPQAY